VIKFNEGEDFVARHDHYTLTIESNVLMKLLLYRYVSYEAKSNVGVYIEDANQANKTFCVRSVDLIKRDDEEQIDYESRNVLDV